MNFVTNPIMKSFVGFDNLFDEFERLSTYKEQSYPAYNIEKISESDYKISLALAGFSEKDITAEVKDGVLSIKASLNNSVNGASFIHRGIAERSFSRQFRLADNIEVTVYKWILGNARMCYLTQNNSSRCFLTLRSKRCDKSSERKEQQRQIYRHRPL